MFPSYIEQLVYVACVHVVMGTHYIVPEYTQVCMTCMHYCHQTSGVVGRERMGTAFPHKKFSGNGVPTREILRDIFLLLPLA